MGPLVRMIVHALLVTTVGSGCKRDAKPKQGDKSGPGSIVLRSMVVDFQGRHLVRVEYRVDNTTNVAIHGGDVPYKAFVLEDAQGRHFRPMDGTRIDGDIQPLDHVDCAVIYDVPAAADVSRVLWGPLVTDDPSKRNDYSENMGFAVELTPEKRDTIPPGFDRVDLRPN